MELLAGFSVVVGSGLLDVTSLGYDMFWLLLLADLVGAALALGIGGLVLRYPWNRIAMLAGGAITAGALALLTSSGTVSFLAAALLLAVAYWRGLAVTQEPPTHAEVQRRFGLGFGVLFLGIIWVVARGIIFQSSIWRMLAVTGIAYTITALIALGTARVEQVREPGAGQTVVVAVGLQLGFLLVLSLLAIQLFAIDIAGWLGHLTQPLWTGVGNATYTALSVLFAPLGWLVDHIRTHAHGTHPLRFSPPPQGESGRHKKLKAPPPDYTWASIAGTVFVILVLAGVGVLIWRTLPRIPRLAGNRGYTDQRRSLWSFDALWRAIRAWLRTLLHRGAETAEDAMSATRRRVLGPSYPSDPIRQLYARTLRRAERSGLSRPSSTTPTEFQLSLSARWPEASEEFAALTGMYVRRRYGEESFDEEEIGAIKQRWRRAQAVMQRRPPEPAPPREQTVEAPVASPAALRAGASPGTLRQRAVQIISRAAGAQVVRDVSVDMLSSILAVVVFFAFVIGLVAYLAFGR